MVNVFFYLNLSSEVAALMQEMEKIATTWNYKRKVQFKLMMR